MKHHRLILIFSVFGLLSSLAGLVLGLVTGASLSPLVLFMIVLAMFSISAVLVLTLRRPHETQAETQFSVEQVALQKASAQGTKNLAILAEAQSHQEEFSGEIIDAMHQSMEISHASSQLYQRVSSFAEHLNEATSLLADIDVRLAELQVSIRSNAAASEQTASAVEQISASIQRIAEVSSERYKDIQTLVKLAQSGQAEMKATREVIKAVTGGIGDLRSFITVIDDIAGRTSILAMNAAIQAAHAGDAGKGFAVVADEVRKLADSSAQNASGIAKRLGALIDGITSARVSSEKTGEILATTESTVARAAHGFMEIEQGTRELAIGGHEILNAALSLKTNNQAVEASIAGITGSSTELVGGVKHLNTEVQAIHELQKGIQIAAAGVNYHSLVITQSSISQHELSLRLMPQDKAVASGSMTGLLLKLAAWIARLRAVLDGRVQIEAESVEDYRSGSLGLWLREHGTEALPDAALYQNFEAALKKLHSLAAQFLRDLPALSPPAREERFLIIKREGDELGAFIRKHLGNLGMDAYSSTLMTWSDAFSVGDEAIDAQHKNLVRLLNELNQALREGRAQTVLAAVLDRIIAYTAEHFSYEESRFKASTYPDTLSHIKEHQALVEQALKLQADVQSGRAVLGTDTVNFLKNWVVKHIQGSDMGYSVYVSQAARGMTPQRLN